MIFPKPEKKIKKEIREKDPQYISWIHTWPCCVPCCGRKFPVDSHHVTTRARLGSDKTAIPLCHDHHLGGIHTKGAKTCAQEWGINYKDLIKKYNNLYDQKVIGPYPGNFTWNSTT